MKKLDVFDLILPDEPDDIDRVADEDSAVENLKAQFAELLERFDQKDRKKMTAEVMEFIKAEIAKIKPIQRVIQKTVEHQVHVPVPGPTPEPVKEIVREVTVKEVAKKDERLDAALSSIQTLQQKLAAVTEELEKVRRTAETPIVVGGSGVIGIPPPEGNEGKILSVSNQKASWSNPTTLPIGDDWRITVDGNNLSVQKLESGSWVEKGAFLP